MTLSSFGQTINKVDWDAHIDTLNSAANIVSTKEKTYLSLRSHISKNTEKVNFGVLLSGGVDSSIISKICKDTRVNLSTRSIPLTLIKHPTPVREVLID